MASQVLHDWNQTRRDRQAVDVTIQQEEDEEQDSVSNSTDSEADDEGDGVEGEEEESGEEGTGRAWMEDYIDHLSAPFSSCRSLPHC